MEGTKENGVKEEKETTLFYKIAFSEERDRNLHGSGMSNATSDFPKLSFRAPWRVGDDVVSRGNAGWTASKSGHLCP